MKKLITISLLFTFYFLLFTFPIHAQDASSTSSIRDLIREKVKEKIDTIVKKPYATLGTLTQITAQTLEVKTVSGKTQLVSTTKDTKYFQMSTGKKKEVKFEDLTYNQFLIAMGYKNEQDVLDAKRILIYDKSPITFDKQMVFGTINTKTTTSLTLQTKGGQLQTFKVGQNTKIITNDKDAPKLVLANLKEGSKVIVIAKPNKDSLEASTVYLFFDQSMVPVSPTAKPTKKPAATPTETP